MFVISDRIACRTTPIFGLIPKTESSADTLMAFVLNVTYAMKTSIAGIFFSLVLTVLNTLFPIKQTRYRVFKKVEVSLQTLWYHIHTVQSEDHDQKDVMEKLVSILEKLDKKLGSEELEDNVEELKPKAS